MEIFSPVKVSAEGLDDDPLKILIRKFLLRNNMRKTGELFAKRSYSTLNDPNEASTKPYLTLKSL